MSTPSPAATAAPTSHVKLEPADTTATAITASSEAPSSTAAATENVGDGLEDGDGPAEQQKPAATVPTTTRERQEPGRFHSLLSSAREGLITVVFVPVLLVVDGVDKLRGKGRRNHWQ